MKLNNPKIDVKKELTELKDLYPGAAFDDKRMVHPDFMFFVVDQYLTHANDILKIIKDEKNEKIN